jgi:large conductance mechanosensitive channel
MSVLDEFKEFAVKGSVIDMAVGFIIGTALTSVVNSLVKDIFTPLLGLFTAGIHFENLFLILKVGEKGGPYATLLQAQADNAITLNIGLFLNSVLSFIIVSVALFFFVRTSNRLKRPKVVSADQINTKECPRCFSAISLKATRCPFCTSDINFVASDKG